MKYINASNVSFVMKILLISRDRRFFGFKAVISKFLFTDNTFHSFNLKMTDLQPGGKDFLNV